MPTSWRSTASRRVSRATPTSACGSTNSRRASSALSSMTIERCAEQFAGAPLHFPQNPGFPVVSRSPSTFGLGLATKKVAAACRLSPNHAVGGGRAAPLEIVVGPATLAGLAHNGFAIVIINGCVHAPDTDAKSRPRPAHMRAVSDDALT